MKKQSKSRDSNIELLRIISMFMVLIVHADYGVLGKPTPLMFRENLPSEMFKLSIEILSLGCVNIFVLISGWFGIQFSLKGLFSFVFQVAFFALGLWGIGVFLGFETNIIEGLAKSCMANSSSYWFVKCYLVLLLMSPFLNAFIVQASLKQFKTILIILIVFQSIYDWLLPGTWYLNGGSSPTSFVILYLLARYIHIYPCKLTSYNKGKYFGGYILASFVTIVLCALPSIIVSNDTVSQYIFGRMLQYSNPFVIISSIALLLYFSKLQIQSTVINKIAISSFAVYLFHAQPCVYDKLFKQPLLKIYNNTAIGGFAVVIQIVVYLIVIYIVAILLDQIRIIIWNKLNNLLDQNEKLVL